MDSITREMMIEIDSDLLINNTRWTLNNEIRRGNFFQAFKLFKELYTVYISIKNTDAAIKTLHEGIIFLLEKRHIFTAITLSQILTKDLLLLRIQPSVKIFDYVQEIFIKFGPTFAGDREHILNKVIQWTIKMCPEYSHGHPDLHKHIGYVYWSESNYSSAEYHYLRSSDGLNFATMLVELHKTRGFKHEVDLFIAQVVLQGLCLRNKVIAELTFQLFTKLHPAINDEPPYTLPLLNFLSFLLKIIADGKLETYKILMEQYQSSLMRDPNFSEYLNKIGQLFFNMR